MQVRHTQTEKLWIEDGIVIAECLEGSVHDLAAAEENVSAHNYLRVEELGGKQVPLVVDARRAKSIERAAREFYTGPANNANVTAVAILVDSAWSRMIANFFIGLNKGPFPIKLFTDKQESIQWLNAYKL
ncbi:MAG: STAS/SEC14 domain-containing protein [Deferribacteres bacterium]|nr:STAS/SEC14 domain-containing protein [candidate division KSB1 bacterium]MCB9503667.1 STAS/SEC14 domain-containing protein [Deferribacteres bacterium]